MKKTKKILSLVLAVLMLVSIVPMAYAEGNAYQVGDIIQFGSYPQSEVKDEATVTALNKLAPDWDDWTSYDYYWGIGDGGHMQMSWMKYTDVEYGGNKYRGVKFIEYRPHTTYATLAASQEENGYFCDIAYWFKFEPLDWRILDPETGFVMCETIIDWQSYNDTFYNDGKGTGYSYFNDQYHKIYANDYEASSIRKWLNEDFYNTAFTSKEKNEVSITTLNNDAQDWFGELVQERNETNDKIFLLSVEDVTNEEFCRLGTIEEERPKAKGSDYAKCQGLYVWCEPGSIDDGTSTWILRTPTEDCSGTAYRVGSSYFSEWVDFGEGIRPALKFNNIYNLNHTHDYKTKDYAPNCTDKGYTTYTCECGDSYVGNYVNALVHKDTNSDYKCDYNCGYEFEKPTPSENCSCNCHKGGIAGFFFKIINFFQKFFGMNATCVCGAAHY